MLKLKKITLRTIILGICTVIIGGLFLGFLPEILGEDVKLILKDKLGDNFRPYLFMGLAFATIVGLLTYLIENTEDEEKKATEDLDLRNELLQNLKEHYQKRLHDKMKGEVRFEIKLNLKYTTQGTSPETVDDFFIIKHENQTGDFNRLFNNYIKNIWRLLIIGEPGAGKSILLLRFGLKLIEWAEKNPELPVPIIIDLASWKDKNETFRKWLEENLPYVGGSFGISKAYSKEIVEKNGVLPLLDGFDEIGESHRDSCMEKLYSYLQEVRNTRQKDIPEVIICSRINEYEAASDAPVFAQVKINPLTPKEIRTVLNPLIVKNDIAAKRLQKAIQTYPQLPQAISSAFFIHTLLHIYSSQSQLELTTQSKDEIQKEIIKKYIQIELEKITDFSISNTQKWLGWLAWKMKYLEGMVTFELTDLQPFWTKRKYSFGSISGLINGSFFGLVFGFLLDSILVFLLAFFIYSFLFGISVQRIKTYEIKTFLLKKLNWKMLQNILIQSIGISLLCGVTFSSKGGLIFGLIGGFVFGLSLSVIDEFSVDSSFPKIKNPYKRLFAQFQREIIQYGVLGVLVFGLGFYYLYDKTYLGFLIGLIIAPISFLFSPLFYHYCLRLTLFLEKSIPRKLVTFLDHISDKTGLLVKSGGHWRFRHQMIHDYLAEWLENNHPTLLRKSELEKINKHKKSEKLGA